jgi:SsrA-binding protein
MAKKPHKPADITNRRARFDYELGDHIQAGIVLTGPEVRAARDGRVNLVGSYVTVKDRELWLTNASFSLPSTVEGKETAVDTSSRKLLAKRQEITKLIAAKDQGLTIVPLRLTTDGRFIKVIIATAKGKKLYDKRETIKKRDTERETRRAL